MKIDLFYIRFFLFNFFILVFLVFGDTFIVKPDGSGDYSTIQAAVDATSSGDTVELTDGTYTGEGNRNITYKGKAITVCSQSGDPETCIINVQGVEGSDNNGFRFISGESEASVLKGVTIKNGNASAG